MIKYHCYANQNVQTWKTSAKAVEGDSCDLYVLPGDWGDVTQYVTKLYGETHASLNMANAYTPGGAYVEGTVAQEENMWRRTDCHFSVQKRERYPKSESNLLNAVDGRVYLDAKTPRVCLRGPEDQKKENFGYKLLDKTEVFPFYELRAAAADLRGGKKFS